MRRWLFHRGPGVVATPSWAAAWLVALVLSPLLVEAELVTSSATEQAFDVPAREPVDAASAEEPAPAAVRAPDAYDAQGAKTTLVQHDAADPEVLVDGDTWYLFSTNADVDGMVANVPTWMSQDEGATWDWVGDVLPDLGAWAAPGRTWAPGAYQRADGTYLLYYTAYDPSTGLQCIGVATSAFPTGPYVDHDDEPLVCQRDLGGSIDPDIYVGADAAYLVWKSDANNPAVSQPPVLWSQPLEPSGLALTGEATALVTGATGDDGVIENPSLFALPDGTIGLLYSEGWWESDDYQMVLARCETPIGPCRSGPVGTSQSRPGGGGSAFTDGNHTYIAYHEWSGPDSYDEGGIRVASVTGLLPWVAGRQS